MEKLPNGSSPKRWLSLGQACQVVGVNASTLRQWGDRGLLRSFRTPGGHRRFSAEDLQGLLDRASEGPSPGAAGASLSDTALRRIRRRLQGERAASFHWYERLDDAVRVRLRLFGHRLLGLTDTYLSQRRRRPELLAEVRLIGAEYGEELARQKLPLRDVLEAFIFFRHSLLSSVGSAAKGGPLGGDGASQIWQHVEVITDELLLCMAEAYERSRNGSIVRVP